MINIKIDKSNKCNGEYSLYISFPYDSNIVSIMRQQTLRYYNPSTKEWEMPIKCFDKLQEQLHDYDINVLNCNKDLFTNTLNKEKYNYIPNNYKFKIEPFKHQVEGINYGLKYDRFLLGDEQGLGKTMQAINIACIKKQQKHYRHCLIICGVNGLKWNWKAEVEKHSNEKAYILGTRYKKDKEYIGNMRNRWEDLRILRDNRCANIVLEPIDKSYFIITNIETLRDEGIIEELKALCELRIIDMIVLDERA